MNQIPSPIFGIASTDACVITMRNSVSKETPCSHIQIGFLRPREKSLKAMGKRHKDRQTDVLTKEEVAQLKSKGLLGCG